jgi:hypothetical protein
MHFVMRIHLPPSEMGIPANVVATDKSRVKAAVEKE